MPDGEPLEYSTLRAPPPHAVPVSVVGGCAKNRGVPGAPGLLTDVGWAQGEVLGRRLRMRYGLPAAAPVVCSTDVSRTVLTAHAVLSGIYGGDAASPTAPPALGITVDTTGDLFPPTSSCAALASSMNAGRSALRSGDEAHQRAREAVAVAFGADYDPALCSMIALHDDCVARRFAGNAPSRCVDVALCDTASREAAREVRAALSHGGDHSARLSAGRLCRRTAEYIRELMAEAEASPDSPTRLVLISGHDTTLFLLLNALDREGEQVGDGVWPPYAASIIFELREDRSVKVLYQFDDLAVRQRGEVVPPDAVLDRLDALSISESEFYRLCGEGSGRGLGGDGAVFRWQD